MEEVMKILVSDDVSEKGVELLRQNGYTVDVETIWTKTNWPNASESMTG